MLKRTIIIHPLLFAAYPVLFLYTNNLSFALGTQWIRPFVIIAVSAALFWFLAGLFLKNVEKAGLLTSLFTVLFFSYGHLNRLMGEFTIWIGDLAIGKSRTLFLIFLLLILLTTVVITRTKRNLKGFTAALNACSVLLILMPLLNILNYTWKAGIASADIALRTEPENKLGLSQEIFRLPNIYYIILDGYARADILENLYDYDNAQFLGRLAQKGFFIAHHSRANYPQTILSLACSLNFDYLDAVADSVGKKSYDRQPLMKMIQDNAVMKFLRRYGYRFVVFNCGYWGVEIRTAEVNMSKRGKVNEFEQLLLDTTPVMDAFFGLKLYDPWNEHRNRIMHNLNLLASTTELQGPVLVFDHILCPHPPFVFGGNGEALSQSKIKPNRYFTYADGIDPKWGLDLQSYRRGYRNQIMTLNKMVENTISEIMSKSTAPPIIILQGDHGPSSLLSTGLSNPDSVNLKERMRILNALFLPDGGSAELYDDITPVNSFRIVLNKYFNADFKLLRDESYFSTWSKPYEFTNVTKIVEDEWPIENELNPK